MRFTFTRAHRLREDTRPRANAIKAVAVTRKMPPLHADPGYGHFANECKLTDAHHTGLLGRPAEAFLMAQQNAKPVHDLFKQVAEIG
jgi:hypothetical protein